MPIHSTQIVNKVFLSLSCEKSPVYYTTVFQLCVKQSSVFIYCSYVYILFCDNKLCDISCISHTADGIDCFNIQILLRITQYDLFCHKLQNFIYSYINYKIVFIHSQITKLYLSSPNIKSNVDLKDRFITTNIPDIPQNNRS